MKYSHLVLVILVTVASSGCRDKPAVPEIKVDSASEALRKDQQDIASRLAEQKAALEANSQAESARTERAKNVDALLPIANKLSAAIVTARSTGRRDFAPLIKSVEAIKVEADAVAVDECTGKVRSDLQESIAITLDAFNAFTNEKTGAADEESGKKVSLVSDQIDAIGKALNACRNLSTPALR